MLQSLSGKTVLISIKQVMCVHRSPWMHTVSNDAWTSRFRQVTGSHRRAPSQARYESLQPFFLVFELLRYWSAKRYFNNTRWDNFGLSFLATSSMKIYNCLQFALCASILAIIISQFLWIFASFFSLVAAKRCAPWEVLQRTFCWLHMTAVIITFLCAYFKFWMV